MKVLDPGHSYRLDNLDGFGTQMLDFVKRVGEDYPGNGELPYSGTNCQEVLRVLIDRCIYLSNQKGCAETTSIIHLLRSALLLFELRAARQHNRHLHLGHLYRIENVETCSTCGHIQCEGAHRERTK